MRVQYLSLCGQYINYSLGGGGVVVQRGSSIIE